MKDMKKEASKIFNALEKHYRKITEDNGLIFYNPIRCFESALDMNNSIYIDVRIEEPDLIDEYLFVSFAAHPLTMSPRRIWEMGDMLLVFKVGESSDDIVDLIRKGFQGYFEVELEP